MSENNKNNGAAVPAERASERFCNLVISKYSDVARGVDVTEKEKAIIAGYFICIDNAIKKMDIKWGEIDTNSLALDLAHKARLGLDMQMPNYLFPVPYRGKNGVVTLTLINGYKGEIHLAMKFAEEIPLNIRAELVYDTDEFVPIKKGAGNPCDSYVFNIKNPFARGNIIGGFGYVEYADPAKNVLVMMSKADILKRKPSYASKEFWGTWEEKMFLKTVIKETCRHIPLDVDKVREYRDTLDYEKGRELDYAKAEAEAEISANAGTGDFIDASFEDSPANEDGKAGDENADKNTGDGQ